MKLILGLIIFIPLSLVAVPLKLITKKGKRFDEFRFHGRTIDGRIT